MSRTTQTTLPDNAAYSKFLNRTMTNLGVSGLGGYAPNLVDWLASQAYMPNQSVCILLAYPKMFDLFYDPKTWISSLKSLVETRAKSITGLYYDALEVTKVDHEVGGAGQLFHEISDVKLKQSSATIEWVSAYGLSIETMLASIIRGKMDPHTKTSMLGTLPEGKIPKDLLADWYTFSILVYEPCPLNRVVQKAIIGCNLFPSLNGDGSLAISRDFSNASAVQTISCEFNGLYDSGPGIIRFAQAILDRINSNNACPSLRPAFIQGRDNAVANATGGYDTGVEFLGNQVTNLTMANKLPESAEQMTSVPDTTNSDGTQNRGGDVSTVFDHARTQDPSAGPIIGRPSATASGNFNGALGST